MFNFNIFRCEAVLSNVGIQQPEYLYKDVYAQTSKDVELITSNQSISFQWVTISNLTKASMNITCQRNGKKESSC